MVLRKVFFYLISSVICVTIELCTAENVTMDFAEKCNINDGDCEMKMFTSLLQKYAKTGFSELGIPTLEPYRLQNSVVSILGMVDLTMIDGTVEGVTSCHFTNLKTDIEKKITTSESICDIIKIAGNYRITAGPLVQPVFGNTLSGEGNGKIQIDKMTLNTKIPFNVVKQGDDGEIYLVPTTSSAEYSTDNIENISFGADNVMFGNQEISEPLMNFMNSNWKIILRSFGKIFSDKVMDTFYDNLKKFLITVPANKFINDDLTSYVS